MFFIDKIYLYDLQNIDLQNVNILIFLIILLSISYLLLLKSIFRKKTTHIPEIKISNSLDRLFIFIFFILGIIFFLKTSSYRYNDFFIFNFLSILSISSYFIFKVYYFYRIFSYDSFYDSNPFLNFILLAIPLFYINGLNSGITSILIYVCIFNKNLFLKGFKFSELSFKKNLLLLIIALGIFLIGIFIKTGFELSIGIIGIIDILQTSLITYFNIDYLIQRFSVDYISIINILDRSLAGAYTFNDYFNIFKYRFDKLIGSFYNFYPTLSSIHELNMQPIYSPKENTGTTPGLFGSILYFTDNIFYTFLISSLTILLIYAIIYKINKNYYFCFNLFGQLLIFNLFLRIFFSNPLSLFYIFDETAINFFTILVLLSFNLKRINN